MKLDKDFFVLGFITLAVITIWIAYDIAFPPKNYFPQRDDMEQLTKPLDPEINFLEVL